MNPPKAPIDEPKTKLLCLLKVGKKEHMEGLRDGKIYCKPLTYYKTIEEDPKPFNDKHEGLSGVLQASRIKMVLRPKGKPEVILDSASGLIDQIYISKNFPSPAFCLHAIHTGEWTDRHFTNAEKQAFIDHLQVSDEMKKFGDHVWVLTNHTVFQERLLEVCKKQKIYVRGGFVLYVDPSQVHGFFEDMYVGFIKSNSFSDEREFRYIFESDKPFNDPFVLDVGSLAGASTVIPLDEFKKTWEIDFEAGAV